jgi:hypothetical protein
MKKQPSSSAVKRKPEPTRTAAQAVQTLAIRPVFEPSEDIATYYANHFEVGQTSHEFFILSGRIPGKISRAREQEIAESGVMVVEPEIQLLVAPTLMPGLIKALTTQLEKWHATHGTQPSQGGGNEQAR